MIVIVTHNGEMFLKNLLSDIKGFNIPNEKVCVVDNQSNQKNSLNYLEELKKDNYHILHNIKSTYEIGAYLYALDNLKDDIWFLMQDVNRLKYDIFSEITSKLTKDNVYTLLTFKTGECDSNYDRFFLNLHFGSTYYSKGVYANTMFALDEVIQKVKNDWIAITPKSKLDSAATERALAAVFDKHNINGEIVIVDNGCTDNTINVVKFFSDLDDRIKVVYQPLKGYGNAYLAGFKHASGKIIVMGDADNSYDFYEIPRFLDALHDNDFVIGNRNEILQGSMPFLHRYIGQPMFYCLMNGLFKLNISDSHCGFGAIKKNALQKLDIPKLNLSTNSSCFFCLIASFG